MTNGNGTGPSLALPKIEVTLDDGRKLEAQILNADLLRWDITAAKHGWPDYRTVQTWHATFCAWASLRRQGAIPKEWTWEEFSDRHCVQVATITDEAGEAEETAVDPTLQEAAPG